MIKCPSPRVNMYTTMKLDNHFNFNNVNKCGKYFIFVTNNIQKYPINTQRSTYENLAQGVSKGCCLPSPRQSNLWLV